MTKKNIGLEDRVLETFIKIISLKINETFQLILKDETIKLKRIA